MDFLFVYISPLMQNIIQYSKLKSEKIPYLRLELHGITSISGAYSHVLIRSHYERTFFTFSVLLLTWYLKYIYPDENFLCVF